MDTNRLDRSARDPSGHDPSGHDPSGHDPSGTASNVWFGLPRRDFILLPLISLCSILVTCALIEITSRVGWPQSETDVCFVTDPLLTHRYKPDCQSIIQSAESPVVINRYNACGYRTDQPCGPRGAATLRLDFMGSSVAQGFLVPYESTISTTLEKALADRCHRPVQVENMAMPGYQGEIIYDQMDEALRLQPDAVVFLVTPFDFDQRAKPVQPGVVTPPKREWLHDVTDVLNESRAFLVAKHFMFANDPIRHAILTLNFGDNADYLRVPFTEAWRDRLSYFSDLIGRMKARLGNVPLVVMFVPSNSQAMFLAAPASWPPGVDPHAFGHALDKVVTSHGVSFVDLSDTFSRIPSAGKLFYPQDGHLTADGHQIVGRDLADRMLADPALLPSCHP
jgi:hypothetical protein